MSCPARGSSTRLPNEAKSVTLTCSIVAGEVGSRPDFFIPTVPGRSRLWAISGRGSASWPTA